jgi:hypothetical protein
LLSGGHEDQGLGEEVEIRMGFGFSADGDSVLLSFRSGRCGGVVLPPLSGDRSVLLSVGVSRGGFVRADVRDPRLRA